MSYSVQVAARTIWGEARGEVRDSQLAVATTIINRLKDGRWGHDLASVCRAREQFSCWNPGDPNAKLLEMILDDDPLLMQLIGLLGEARSAKKPLHSAKWYKNKGLGWPKDWGPERAPCASFGGLEFFDLDGGMLI
jgi:hypothetical protein